MLGLLQDAQSALFQDVEFGAGVVNPQTRNVCGSLLEFRLQTPDRSWIETRGNMPQRAILPIRSHGPERHIGIHTAG
jgi:hypothetical protein